MLPRGFQVVVVTGATGAIGRKIAEGVLARPDTALVLPLRASAAAEQLVDELRSSADDGWQRVFAEPCDLASYASVRDCCARIASNYGGQVGALINTAATISPQRQTSADGVELQWQVNVLSYYWLMHMLSPCLLAAARGESRRPSRVVNLAARLAGGLQLDDVEFRQRPYTPKDAYTQSKQANRMMTAAAARLLFPDAADVLVNSCHPGVVTSRLLASLGFPKGTNTAEEGARTPLYLAFDDAVPPVSGAFFADTKQQPCSFSKDQQAVDRLWQLLADQTAQLQRTVTA